MFELVLISTMAIISLAAAIYAVLAKTALNAVIATGIISLMASVIFLVVGAPDVAMTEAAIGSGLTTVVFIYALKHVSKGREKSDD